VFSEALESYRQALTLITPLSESPERDNRELNLRRSVRIEHIAALAEKSGNLGQLEPGGVAGAKRHLERLVGERHGGG